MTKDPLLVAVDALAVELGIGTDGLAFTWDQLECLNRILAVHAHELAEKIRERQYLPPLSGEEIDFNNTALWAAGLIDPEVAS